MAGVVGVGHFRRHLANNAQAFAAHGHHDLRGQPGQAVVARVNAGRQLEMGDQRLDDAFDVAVAGQLVLGPGPAVGLAQAVERNAQTSGLPGRGLGGGVGGEHPGDFEQAQVGVAVGQVVAHRGQQSRGQHGPHDVLILGQRIGHGHAAGGVQTQNVEIGVADEAVVDRLAKSQAHGEGPHPRPETELGLGRHVVQGLGHPGQTRRDAVQAVHPPHFLNEVGLALQVQAVGRRGHGDNTRGIGLGKLAAKAGEHLAAEILGHVLAKQHGGPGRTEADAARGEGLGLGHGHTGQGRAAGGFEHQRHGAV